MKKNSSQITEVGKQCSTRNLLDCKILKGIKIVDMVLFARHTHTHRI